MNNKKIDDILTQLQNEPQPIIPDADLLTDSIMDALPDLDAEEEAAEEQPVQQKGKVVPMWISVMRSITSVAAMLIIGVFIYTQFIAEDETNRHHQAYHQTYSSFSTINIARKCCLESQNKQFSYSQIKRMINENR